MCSPHGYGLRLGHALDRDRNHRRRAALVRLFNRIAQMTNTTKSHDYIAFVLMTLMTLGPLAAGAQVFG